MIVVITGCIGKEDRHHQRRERVPACVSHTEHSRAQEEDPKVVLQGFDVGDVKDGQVNTDERCMSCEAHNQIKPVTVR